MFVVCVLLRACVCVCVCVCMFAWLEGQLCMVVRPRALVRASTCSKTNMLSCVFAGPRSMPVCGDLVGGYQHVLAALGLCVCVGGCVFEWPSVIH